ncbi:Protein-export protein SecB [Burkholderiales bacterium]|nr:Protein-export protein SecB [Burkholderiales bacterium]
MAESLVSQNAVRVAVEKIYVKDLSLENPGSPQSFKLTEPPSVEIGLRTRAEQIEPDVYECVMTVTITATAGERTVFLVEVAQAGIFTVQGATADQLQPILAMHCPAMLFPYARQSVATATMNAGFPPVHLQPINFEALYAQQLDQKAADAGATAAA